jgi:O-antigen/teichoic acid export membrane protein
MSETPPPGAGDARGGEVTRGEVARGAGLAGLSRAGALIEALAQPLYTWLFGIATYGVYVVMWGAVNLVENFIDLSMTTALQRIVPTREKEEAAHAAVKIAFLVALTPAFLIALLVSLNAAWVASFISAAPEDVPHLPGAVALFAWTLPLWTFVEVATSAARARRAFGPEIRIRIFWEQIARIVFATGFFFLGFRSTGLMIGHLCSLTLTAGLCVPLLRRYYDLRLLIAAPLTAPLAREAILTGLGLLPGAFARRLLIDAPTVVLNLMLPGARGAATAGLFEIARKLSTVTFLVRQAFQYVLGPLASAQAHADRARLAPLYHFSSRVSTALVVPLGGLLAFGGKDILSVYRPEALAALPMLNSLDAGRALEAIDGPASVIVEMTGHRVLPLLNSLVAFVLWGVLSLWLIPGTGPLGGGMGMAVAVAVATVASTYAATVELRISDGLTPFDRRLLAGLAIALAGVALMWGVTEIAGGPVRFVLVLALWALASRFALRHGLTRDDRLALGGLAKPLRLVKT